MKAIRIILRTIFFSLIRYKKAGSFCFLLLACMHLGAQSYNDDARLWVYLKLDKDIIPKFNAQLIIQNRLDNNITRYGQLNGNIELSYRLNKNLKFLVGYVYGKVRRREQVNYSNRQQAYAGFIVKGRWRRFVFFYRNLFQAQMTNVYTSKNGMIPSWYDRNKVTIKYELTKRWEVYIAEEINIRLFRVNSTLNNPYINRSRSFIGVQYNISRRSYIESYFLFQRKYGSKRMPERAFIYGLTYSYSF